MDPLTLLALSLVGFIILVVGLILIIRRRMSNEDLNKLEVDNLEKLASNKNDKIVEKELDASHQLDARKVSNMQKGVKADITIEKRGSSSNKRDKIVINKSLNTGEQNLDTEKVSKSAAKKDKPIIEISASGFKVIQNPERVKFFSRELQKINKSLNEFDRLESNIQATQVKHLNSSMDISIDSKNLDKSVKLVKEHLDKVKNKTEKLNSVYNKNRLRLEKEEKETKEAIEAVEKNIINLKEEYQKDKSLELSQSVYWTFQEKELDSISRNIEKNNKKTSASIEEPSKLLSNLIGITDGKKISKILDKLYEGIQDSESDGGICDKQLTFDFESIIRSRADFIVNEIYNAGAFDKLTLAGILVCNFILFDKMKNNDFEDKYIIQSIKAFNARCKNSVSDIWEDYFSGKDRETILSDIVKQAKLEKNKALSDRKSQLESEIKARDELITIKERTDDSPESFKQTLGGNKHYKSQLRDLEECQALEEKEEKEADKFVKDFMTSVSSIREKETMLKDISGSTDINTIIFSGQTDTVNSILDNARQFKSDDAHYGLYYIDIQAYMNKALGDADIKDWSETQKQVLCFQLINIIDSKVDHNNKISKDKVDDLKKSRREIIGGKLKSLKKKATKFKSDLKNFTNKNLHKSTNSTYTDRKSFVEDFYKNFASETEAVTDFSQYAKPYKNSKLSVNNFAKRILESDIELLDKKSLSNVSYKKTVVRAEKIVEKLEAEKEKTKLECDGLLEKIQEKDKQSNDDTDLLQRKLEGLKENAKKIDKFLNPAKRFVSYSERTFKLKDGRKIFYPGYKPKALEKRDKVMAKLDNQFESDMNRLLDKKKNLESKQKDLSKRLGDNKVELFQNITKLSEQLKTSGLKIQKDLESLKTHDKQYVDLLKQYSDNKKAELNTKTGGHSAINLEDIMYKDQLIRSIKEEISQFESIRKAVLKEIEELEKDTAFYDKDALKNDQKEDQFKKYPKIKADSLSDLMSRYREQIELLEYSVKQYEESLSTFSNLKSKSGEIRQYLHKLRDRLKSRIKIKEDDPNALKLGTQNIQSVKGNELQKDNKDSYDLMVEFQTEMDNTREQFNITDSKIKGVGR